MHLTLKSNDIKLLFNALSITIVIASLNVVTQ